MGKQEKHTPGPWEIVKTDPDRIEVCSRLHCVAVIDDVAPRWEDDARLIAAAPAMLAALRDLVNAEKNGWQVEPLRAKARAIIRQATGEES